MMWEEPRFTLFLVFTMVEDTLPQGRIWEEMTCSFSEADALSN
jgi:hypothetical protein